MAKLLEEIHPGEILLEDFMKPMGISARQLAAHIDVSPSRVSELVNGQRPITAATDLRLCRFIGLSDGWSLRLQADYGTEVARAGLAKISHARKRRRRRQMRTGRASDSGHTVERANGQHAADEGRR